MNVLIVYGTQFGTTEHLAYVLASALEPEHQVRVARTDESRELSGDHIDLLLVGSPTQFHGLRLLVRPFLSGLRAHGFRGVPAAAFDTRGEGPVKNTGSEAEMISQRLASQGCRVIAPPESFVVADYKGPLARGEEQRARDWVREVARAAQPVTA